MEWSLRFPALFRESRIEHVLQPSLPGRVHSNHDQRMGIDILVDCVAAELILTVKPVGIQNPTPLDALNRLQQMFGGVNINMQMMHEEALSALRQQPGESVQTYLLHASRLHDEILLSQGMCSDAHYIQCICRGVLAHLDNKVQMFLNMPAELRTMPALSGQLRAEEARLAVRNSLPSSMIQQTAAATVPQQQQGVMAVTQPSTAPSGSRQSNPIRDPENYRLTAAVAQCWNCGKIGHRHGDCNRPKVTPFQWAPNKGSKGPPPPPSAPPAPPSSLQA